MSDPESGPPIRFVAFHYPGPAWEAGTEFAEQPGVHDHVAHFAAALGEGHLERGGPFIDSSGGMMIFASSVSQAQAEEIAESDPAVLSGLLRVEVRPWLAAMGR